MSSPIPSSFRLNAIDSADDTIMLMPSHMPEGYQGTWHCHRKGQLIYPQKGRYRIYTRDHMWTGSPHRACWIPAGIEHTVHALAPLDIHNVYIADTLSSSFPSHCLSMPVTPLLDELLAFGTTLPHVSDEQPSALRVHTLALIAEIIGTTRDTLMGPLPLSSDQRVRQVMNALLNDPANNNSLEYWADKTHTTARTLARRFQAHTGMAFNQWRQQLRVTEAIVRLESGHAIKRIASDLGYSSQSAFTAMFHRVTGRAPSQFKVS